jgi:hypothetical protein
MKKINEYNTKPLLSANARKFIETYDGGQVPEEIKIELKKYLHDIEPEIVKSKNRLLKLLND